VSTHEDAIQNPEANGQGMCQVLLEFAQLPSRLSDAEQRLAEIRAVLACIGERQQAQKALLENVSEHCRKVEGGVEALFRKEESLEKASALQAMLGETHYQEHVILPLVRHLWLIYDWAAEAQQNWKQSDVQVIGLLEAVRSQVIELLSVFGVEPIEEIPGSPFDGRIMRALEAPAGDGSGKALSVSETLRIGFRFGLRVLRPQIVILQPTVEDGTNPSSNEPTLFD